MTHKAFGHLRSLTSQRPLPFDEIIDHLQRMYLFDTERYADEVLPYLSDVPWPHLSGDHRQVERYDRLLPETLTFGLEVHPHPSEEDVEYIVEQLRCSNRIDAVSYTGRFMAFARALYECPMPLTSLYLTNKGRDFDPTWLPEMSLEHLSLNECDGVYPWLERYSGLKRLMLIDSDLELSDEDIFALTHFVCSGARLEGSRDVLNMPQLIDLDIGRGTLESDELESIFEQAEFCLKSLRADYSGLTSNIFEHLERHDLVYLDLSGNYIESLGRLPYLPQLTHLNLNGCRIDPKSLRGLPDRLPELVELQLDQVHWTKEIAQLCLAMPNLKQVEIGDVYVSSREKLEVHCCL